MASVFGALNGNVLTKPRVAYALSRDGLTFAFLGRAHERWGTPHAALVIQGAVAALMTWGFYLKRPDKPGDLFDALTTYFVVVEWFALLFAVGAVIVLRIRRPVEPRPFRTPLYPWVPIVFIAGTAYGLWHIVRGEVAGGNWAPVWGLLITGAGFPVYFVWRFLSRQRVATGQ
jgi:amino acid transporter